MLQLELSENKKGMNSFFKQQQQNTEGITQVLVQQKYASGTQFQFLEDMKKTAEKQEKWIMVAK